MIQVLKKTWRQRLLSLLLPILLVFAIAGVGMKVPVQAAGNDAGAQTGEMKVHFLDVGQRIPWNGDDLRRGSSGTDI